MAEHNVLKCCFTGYRPQKFGFKFSHSDAQYVQFENMLTDWILKLLNEDCKFFYTGMAMGFDIVAAENVALMKKARPELGIKLVCVVPFLGQENGFSPFWQEKYNYIITNHFALILIIISYLTLLY